MAQPAVARLPSVFLLAVAAVGPLFAAAAKVEIQAMKHDIQLIQASNFDGVIGKFRDSSVSSLWFFKEDKSEDQALLAEYDKVAKELKGMAKVCAISCSDYPEFCRKNNIVETPTVMIYPTNPIPAFKFEGKMEAKAISAKIARFIPDFSVRVTKDNVDTFLTTEPSKPKVLLFSNKKIPTDYLEGAV